MTLDLDVLQAAAEAATPGPWEAEVDDGEGTTEVNAGSALTAWTEHQDGLRIGSPARSWRTTDRIVERDDLYDEDFEQAAADAEFIAATNPAVVLELVAAHRAALARIARVEALHDKGTIYELTNDYLPDESRPILVYCAECTADSTILMIEDCEWDTDWPVVVWPCPTVRALSDDPLPSCSKCDGSGDVPGLSCRCVCTTQPTTEAP